MSNVIPMKPVNKTKTYIVTSNVLMTFSFDGRNGTKDQIDMDVRDEERYVCSVIEDALANYGINMNVAKRDWIVSNE